MKRKISEPGAPEEPPQRFRRAVEMNPERGEMWQKKNKRGRFMRRKWKKRIISLIAGMMVLLIAAMPVFGVTKELNVPLIMQAEDESCCWACAGAMVCQYHGVGGSLDQFIFNVKGTTSHYVSGSSSDIMYGVRQQGLNATLYTYKNFWFEHIVDEINAGRPVIGSGLADGWSHAYVYIGYDDVEREVCINDSSYGYNWSPFVSFLARSGGESHLYETPYFIVVTK